MDISGGFEGGLLSLVTLEPLLTTEVGEVLDLEVFEGGFEALTIGAGGHESDLDGAVVGHPGIAHHGVFFVVEGVEYFDGIESANGFHPDVGDGLVEGDDAPVGGVVGDDGADVVLAVDIFYTGLDVVFFVDTEHEAGLVETGDVVAADLDFGFELATVCGVVEGGVVDGETVVGYAPVVGLGGDLHGEFVALYGPLCGFIEPLHFLEGLGGQGGQGCA